MAASVEIPKKTVFDNNPKDHWIFKGLKKVLSKRDKIAARVDKGLKKHKGNAEANADDLIRQKLKRSTAYGIITGGIGVVPVMGTLGAIAAATTVEFAALSYQEMLICMELAHNYGHDIRHDRRIFETLAIIGRQPDLHISKNVGQGTVNKAVNTTVGKFVKLGILRTLGKTAASIETRLGLRTFSKALPVAGVILGGALNYHSMQSTSAMARTYYRSKAKMNTQNGEDT